MNLEKRASALAEKYAAYGRASEVPRILEAFAFAAEAHKDQFRQSGEPYVTHPLAVAEIVADMELDSDSICAALLHDTVEDTPTTTDEIAGRFGAHVAEIVDGLTKLDRIPYSSKEEQEVENLRKMLLAMSKDIRVILIKLADRLHNIRTLDAKPDIKRRETALETMDVYSPIAHRLGVTTIKQELEDRSLRYLDPIGYDEIMSTLEENNRDYNFIEAITESIRTRLAEGGLVNVEITSRVKSVYGIYRKLYIQNRSMEEIYDVYAVRVIVSTVTECYNALGILHDMYRPIPNRFKDYISTPKPNMYQSLHTTVIGKEAIPFEIQIRTVDMHYTAEYGIAAHWKYKVGISGKDRLEERLAWVRQLLESQQESEDSAELLRDIKSDLLPEEVFVFTPKGDVIDLPAGATVIDFAYAIHSAVGNRMVGAKVNGRIVPITYRVKTGEIVEIITGAKDKGPSRDWLSIVQTSEAKNKIRSWFKRERRDENIAEGKQAFERELRRNLINIPPEHYDTFMDEIVKRQKLNSQDELFAALGYGGLLMSRLLPKVRDEYQKLVAKEDPVEVFKVPTAKKSSTGGVIVEGIDNCLVKFAHCCNPLPGDSIVGFITRGHGVSIHKTDCINVAAGVDSPRIVQVTWADDVRDSFKSTLEMVCKDRTGLIADITAQLSSMHIPIYAFSTRVSEDAAIIIATVGISNTEHLDSVVSRLRKIKSIEDIRRTTN